MDELLPYDADILLLFTTLLQKTIKLIVFISFLAIKAESDGFCGPPRKHRNGEFGGEPFMAAEGLPPEGLSRNVHEPATTRQRPLATLEAWIVLESS